LAILTSNARNHLRPAEFAVRETRSYPIPDEGHARNALSRVAEFGSSREQARVRAAVHHKFPSVGSPKPAENNQHKSIGHRIIAMTRGQHSY